MKNVFAMLLGVWHVTGALAGSIETVAGSGQAGYSGDGGPAVAARLNQPFHCDFDNHGNLYVADALNHCIRKIDRKTGLIRTVAGSGRKGYSGDQGPATQATLNEPYAVAVDPSGDLYIVDRLNAVIRKVDGRTGIINTIAGTGRKGFGGDGGPATRALLREPNDCCLDGKGGLLVADVGDGRIRRVDLQKGTISTFAGTGRPRGKLDRSQRGDGGPASAAVIVGARAVCVDGQGNTFICEREGNVVRKIDARGVITTIAGTGQSGDGGDGGPALQAIFRGPKGIRCDRSGNLYLVDTENHAIRKIDAKSGKITTVAGGRKGSDGDGGDALKAGLARPHGCCIRADGDLFIADSENHRIRKVSRR
jgi:sugar lactone lactonase YvrE